MPKPAPKHSLPCDDIIPAQYPQGEGDILILKEKVAALEAWRRGTDGELIHDDYLLADALVAGLDRLDWSVNTEAQTVAAPDPLLSMERNF